MTPGTPPLRAATVLTMSPRAGYSPPVRNQCRRCDTTDASAGVGGVRKGTVAPMVLELADIAVRPGQEDAFTDVYREAVAQLRASPGFRSARLTRGIESPARFVLLVEWDDLEAFFDGAPRVEHFTDVSADPEASS